MEKKRESTHEHRQHCDDCRGEEGWVEVEKDMGE